jgi:hypothetical protein
VRAPSVPQWQRSAVGWLLDLCPPDYRGYPVLQRYPVALARLAAHQVEASTRAAARALATARADLGQDLPVPAMALFIEAVEVEQARLLGAARAVSLIEDALRGRRYLPRC